MGRRDGVGEGRRVMWVEEKDGEWGEGEWGKDKG